MSLTKLSKCIVPPNRLASILSWTPSASTVMALDISDERIGVSIAKHPSPNNQVYPLEPIPYVSRSKNIVTGQGGATLLRPTRRIDENGRVALTLEELVKQHNICGFVVGWPLQPDGRPGGPCGKVLHLLDHLAEHPSLLLFAGRPCALWDIGDIPFNAASRKRIKNTKLRKESHMDEWGRDPKFSTTPTQVVGSHVYRPGEQFYYDITNDSNASAMMLKHYMDSHWEPDEEEEEAVHVDDTIVRPLIRTTMKCT